MAKFIFMLREDVANCQACRHAMCNGACNLTFLMKDLCLETYIIDVMLVFSMLYSEGDQNKRFGNRVFSALMWVIVTTIDVCLMLGIVYGLVGKIKFTI